VLSQPVLNSIIRHCKRTFCGKLRTRLLCGEAEMQVAFDMLNLRAVGVSIDMDLVCALFGYNGANVVVRKCHFARATADTFCVRKLTEQEGSPWHGMGLLSGLLASAIAGNDVTLMHIKGVGNMTAAGLVQQARSETLGVPPTDIWRIVECVVDAVVSHIGSTDSSVALGFAHHVRFLPAVVPADATRARCRPWHRD
jgi:hypothetical protein